MPSNSKQGSFGPDPSVVRVQKLGNNHARVLFADAPKSAHVEIGTDKFYEAMTHVGDVEEQRKHLESAGIYNVGLLANLHD